jgi:hypothetical protein
VLILKLLLKLVDLIDFLRQGGFQERDLLVFPLEGLFNGMLEGQ